MAGVGWLTSEVFLQHEPAGYHPENPGRLRAASTALAEAELLAELTLMQPRSATEEDVRLAHSAEHLERVRATADCGPAQLDADTYVNGASYHVALQAVGGAMAIVDALADGDLERGLLWARPPGHHATAQTPMGFCLFNNVAIAARHAQRRGLERVLIIDWDVHHGNGTQDIFWRDPSVAYFSSHQFPLYPGTGTADEIGAGDGEGFNANALLAAGAEDADLMAAFDRTLLPLWQRLDPQIVLVSAGFDAHERDPLAQLRVSTTGFRRAADWVLERAASLPVAFLLEGGYDPQALGESTVEVARAALGKN